MSPVTLVATFAIVWWLVLFVVLPIGIERNEAPPPGTDPGAPKSLNLVRKFAQTTVIAVVVLIVIVLVLRYTGFDFYREFSK